MIGVAEITAELKAGYERRRFELKGPGARTDKAYFAKVVRAAMALGNLRDGGFIILGLDEKQLPSLRPGLSQLELASWLDYDAVSQSFANFADPPITFDVAQVDLAPGISVAVLQIYEFDHQPHVCIKSFPDALTDGAVYVRPRKKTESSAVATSFDMRELLDLAVQKQLRNFVRIATLGGVSLTIEQEERHSERFEDQRKAGWQ